MGLWMLVVWQSELTAKEVLDFEASQKTSC